MNRHSIVPVTLSLIIILAAAGCRSFPRLSLFHSPQEPFAKVTDLAQQDGSLLPDDFAGAGGGSTMPDALPVGDWTARTGVGPWDDAGKPFGQDAVRTSQEWQAVYFGFNKSFIAETEKVKLEKLGEFLVQNKQYALVIEGHCDERGSDEFNRALGEDRAIAVRNYLQQLGVEDARMTTVSYGEDKPAVKGQTEEAYALNRRAEFVVVSSR